MKKFLASALALAMALSLTACGGGQSGGSQSSGGQSNSGQSSGGGSGAVTVKVGGIGPITGDQAQYGTATAWGAEIAVEEINALNGPVRLEPAEGLGQGRPLGHLRLHHHRSLRGRGLRDLRGPVFPAHPLRLLP